MPSEILALVVACIAGAGLALGFFWGLWATVAGIDDAPRPVSRLLVSALLRFGVVLLAFFLVARYGGWQALAAAAVGFVATRTLLVRAIVRRQGRGEPAP
jgi:F1F0 ATPase subunit 2